VNIGFLQNIMQAALYYSRADNIGKLAEALLASEDWDGLIRLVERLPERDPLLPRLGDRFRRAALLQNAVDAFCKARSWKLNVSDSFICRDVCSERLPGAGPCCPN
jgi:hypothetical protein